MNVIKKRLIKHTIYIFLGIVLFAVMLATFLYNCKNKMLTSSYLYSLIGFLVSTALSTFLLVVGIDNFYQTVKYYLYADEPVFKSPRTYKKLYWLGYLLILLAIVSVALFFIFKMMFFVALIVFFPFASCIVFITAMYVRDLYFEEKVEAEYIECPLCGKKMHKKAHYCVYCNTNFKFNSKD